MAKKKVVPLNIGIVEIRTDKLMSRAASVDEAANTLNQLTYPDNYKIVSLTAQPRYLFDLLDARIDASAKELLKSLSPELLTKYLARR